MDPPRHSMPLGGKTKGAERALNALTTHSWLIAREIVTEGKVKPGSAHQEMRLRMRTDVIHRRSIVPSDEGVQHGAELFASVAKGQRGRPDALNGIRNFLLHPEK